MISLGVGLASRVVLAVKAAARYVLTTPILLESFSNVTDWAASAGATLTGEGDDIAMTADGTQAPVMTKTNLGIFDKATDLGVIATLVDLGDDPEYQTCTSIDTRLGSAGTYRGATGVTNPSLSDINLGKAWASFDISDIPFHPSGLAQVDLQMKSNNTAPRCETVKLDRVYRLAQGRPTILMNFDNAYNGIYNIAFPIMSERNFKGSCFVGGDGPGGDVIGGDFHMTVEMLQALYAAGWDICPNGTATDDPMTDHASVADAVADIDSVKAWLISKGFHRGLECFCYPNGSARVAGDEKQVAAVTSDGSNIVVMASTSGIEVGYKAAGALVPRSPATTVVSVDSATQLTLSAAIPSGTSAMSFTDTSGPFHTGKLQAGLKAAGYKFGRLTANGTRFTRFGLGDQGLVFPTYSWNTFSDLDALKVRLDAVEKRGHTISIFAHNVSDTDVLPATFESFMDEVKTRVDENRFDVLTMSQFIARDGNARPPD
jgi:hypothetical protein